MGASQRVDFPPPRTRWAEAVLGCLMTAVFGVTALLGISVCCGIVVAWLYG